MRPKSLLAALVTATLAAASTSALVEPAAAAPPTPAAQTSASRTVVLPTGERVQISALDTNPQVLLHHGSGQPAVQVLHIGDRTYALPIEATPYLGGTLDLGLFDVAQLAQHPSRIPVSLRLSAASVPGVRITSRSGDSAKGYLTPASAARFGAALRAGRTSVPGLDRMALDVAQPTTVTAVGSKYTLHIRVETPSGVTPDAVILFIVNTDDSRMYNKGLQLDGTDGTLRVPAGHYTIEADAITAPTSENDHEIDRWAFLTDLHVTADGQTAILDTAQATASGYPQYDVPRPTKKRTFNDLFYAIYDDRGVLATYFELPDFFGLDLFAQSVTGGTHGKLTSVAVALKSAPSSATTPYSYYLTSAHRNAVVGGEQITVPQSSLATIQTHYYGDGRPLLGSSGRFPKYPYLDPGEFVQSNAPGAPLVRDEYLYSPPGVTWVTVEEQYLADGSADTEIATRPEAFLAGSTYREDFARGPLGAGLLSQPGIGGLDCDACRSADTMLVGVVPFTDTDPQHIGQIFGTEQPEIRVKVLEDGRTVYNGTGFYGKATAQFQVSPGDHGYQIIGRRDATPDGAILSTHGTTVWTFRASPKSGNAAPSSWGCGAHPSSACTVLPILTVSDALPTSLTGTLPAGRSTTVVTVGHVRGAAPTRITGLTFGVAVDGQPFVPQSVAPLGGGRFQVTVVTPDVAAGTGISVRVHANDATGAALTQTVQTAYTVAAT